MVPWIFQAVKPQWKDDPHYTSSSLVMFIEILVLPIKLSQVDDAELERLNNILALWAKTSC